MHARARVGWIAVGLASAIAAAWALRPSPSPPRPAPTETRAAPTVSPPAAQKAQPVGLEGVVSPDAAAAPSPAFVAAKPDPRCPRGTWSDDDSTHAGAGHGCLVPGPDGGMVRDGVWSIRDADGNVKSGELVLGLPEGRWISVYSNGRQAWEASYVHGAPEGLRIDWGPDGAKVAEHHYRDGMLDGPATITHPDGTVVTELWRKGMRVDLPSMAFGADAQ